VEGFNPRQPISRRSLIKALGLAGVATAGLGGLSGCAGSTAESHSGKGGGGLSGRISFSNYEGWIGKHTIRDFQHKYPGAEVNEVHVDGSFTSILPKLKQQPGLYDMALASIDGVGRALQLGVIEPMDFSAMPNMKHLDPKFVEIGVNAQGDNFVPTDNGKVGIGIRTDLVHDDLTSWADLWSLAPRYKGKIYVYDYDKDLMGTAMLLGGHQVNSRNPGEIAAAGAALEQLKPYIGSLATSGIGAALVNGDAAIAVTYDYEVFAAQQQNSKVQWVAPDEGMTGYLEGWVALKGTSGLDIIQAFTNFNLTPQYYADFVRRTDAAYVERGIEDLLPKKLSESPILFPPPDVLSKVTFEEYLGEAEPLYSEAYAKFKAA